MIYSEPSVESDCYFHIPLLIVTKHILGLPFPPRNLPIKFGTNPSTIFLVIVSQTDTHTHKPTPVKTYSLAFAGRQLFITDVSAIEIEETFCGRTDVCTYVESDGHLRPTLLG